MLAAVPAEVTICPHRYTARRDQSLHQDRAVQNRSSSASAWWRAAVAANQPHPAQRRPDTSPQSVLRAVQPAVTLRSALQAEPPRDRSSLAPPPYRPVPVVPVHVPPQWKSRCWFSTGRDGWRKSSAGRTAYHRRFPLCRTPRKALTGETE